jgi:hypothetical protein
MRSGLPPMSGSRHFASVRHLIIVAVSHRLRSLDLSGGLFLSIDVFEHAANDPGWSLALATQLRAEVSTTSGQAGTRVELTSGAAA